MLCKAKPNMSNMSKDIKSKFNMVSKPFFNETHGTFCQMVLYKTNLGGAGMGPDWVRLKNRFEVTNG
jgi:hypothetical protein